MDKIKQALEDLFITLTSKEKTEIPDLGLTDTMKRAIAQSLFEDLKKESEKFSEDLVDKLSDPLPKHLKHRKRPQFRLFPFKDIGDLVNSYKEKVEFKEKNPDHYVVSVDVSFSSDHAYYTNTGKAGKVRSTGKWVGWLTDMFAKNGRAGVPSIIDVNKEVFKGSRIDGLIARYFSKGQK